MMKRIIFVVIVLVIIAALALVIAFALNSFQKSNSETTEQIVVDSVSDIGEVALVELSVVDIYDEQHATTLPVIGELLGSERKKFLRVEFDAKLGINGNEVVVTSTGANTYEVKVPSFIFIGYDNFSSELAAEENGLLSWTNQETDTNDMLTDILGEENKQEYLSKYDTRLRSSAELFFAQMIEGIDPNANVTFVFSS